MNYVICANRYSAPDIIPKCQHVWNKQTGVEYKICLKCGEIRTLFRSFRKKSSCQHDVMQPSPFLVGMEQCTKCRYIDYRQWIKASTLHKL